jgi:hypothetical protein
VSEPNSSDSKPKPAITRATGIALVVMGLLIAIPSGLCTAAGLLGAVVALFSSICCGKGLSDLSAFGILLVSVVFFAIGYGIFRLGDRMYRK